MEMHAFRSSVRNTGHRVKAFEKKSGLRGILGFKTGSSRRLEDVT
jgi:hypothetical protein